VSPKGVIAHAVRAAILVGHTLIPIEPRAEPIRRDADPNAHRKASLSLGDHEHPELAAIVLPILFVRRQLSRSTLVKSSYRWQRQHAATRSMDGLLSYVPIIEMGLFACLRDPGQRLAASDADCSNAAFFIAHPFAPQFAFEPFP